MNVPNLTHENQRFSIRKYSFGAASVLLGVSLIYAGQASADEPSQPVVTLEQSVASTPSSPLQNENNSTSSSPATVKETAASSSTLSERNSEPTGQSNHKVNALSDTSTQPSEIDSQSVATGTETPANNLENKSNVAQPVDVQKMLPQQGTYRYPRRTDIRNALKVSAPVQFYVNKGDKFFYDKVVASDGYQWVRYLSYSGVRRYAPIEKLAVAQPLPRPEKSKVVSKSVLPESGTYRFSKEVAVKNSPKASAKTEFTFAKGERIYYDRTLEADHYQWLSYVSYSGIRRYVALAQLIDSPTINVVKPKPKASDINKLASSGTYHFTQDRLVKNKPEVSAKTEFIYRSGSRVNYDRYLVNDGHHWLSYVSYNGVRRYVDLGSEVSSQSVAKPIVNHRLYGRLTIDKLSSDGFTITVSEVASPRAIKAIKVPVWSDKGGQDDLIWYTAQKQDDVRYRVRVSTKDHKSVGGLYHVHLYYDYGAGQLTGIVGATITVPNPAPSSGAVNSVTIPKQGSYTFSKRVYIKAKPSQDSPILAYYDAGASVNYDQVITIKGQRWLSYISYKGLRRYIAIS